MFKHKQVFFFLYFIITAFFSNAQTANTDSLQAIVKSSAGNAEKVIAYKALSQAMLSKDFDECQAASVAGAALAEKLKDYPSLAEFKKFTGLAWYFKGSYDSAAVYYYIALDILKKTDAPLVKAGLLNELGKLYRKTKDLDRSLQMYDEAFAIYQKQHDDDNMATILNESGVVFEYKEDYAEAIKRYKSSLAIREKLNDVAGKAYSLNFLGGVYTLQKNFIEAENYLLQSLQLRIDLKDSFATALNYTDLGYMYKEQAKYDKAAEQYNLSNSIAAKLKYAELQQSNYKELAGIAEKTGNFALSLDYYKFYFQRR
jgi:two-component system, NarL family, sensor kinase